VHNFLKEEEEVPLTAFIAGELQKKLISIKTFYCPSHSPPSLSLLGVHHHTLTPHHQVRMVE